jgi:outer membrane protein
MKYLVIIFFTLLSLPLLAWDCGTPCDSSWGIAAEMRVAYYHPSSKRVRDIYGKGWADYQLELSKSFKNCGGLEDVEWRIWTGISGFSKNGDSIGLHNKTKIQLVPISLGLKIFYPIICNTKVFLGGAACYSLLRIHDHSEYVHEHIRKESWGGIFQSGITYDFCSWAFASIFLDYYFQRFVFHNDRTSHCRFVERMDLNMNGFKVGAGLGISF